jgi:hypothetical protein
MDCATGNFEFLHIVYNRVMNVLKRG